MNRLQTSKLPDIGTTIFTTMSQLAAESNAINLGQGFPDFSPDVKLVDAVTRAMKEGHNQYPPMAGILSLRQSLSNKIKNIYGHTYDPVEEITITSGATEALMASIMALVHPGDEVIVIEPFYDLYVPAITLAGGVPVTVSMQAPTSDCSRYVVDWEQIRRVISSRTRLLILNFPHNPTGTSLRDSDLDELEKIVNDTGIMLLSDEVYEHVVFDGNHHRSLSSRANLATNAVVVSSFGKTYHITGWKIGYCSAPKRLMTEIRKVHQFLVFTVSTPMQIALADYMQDSTTWTGLADFYERKRDHLTMGLKTTRLKPLPSESTFFLLADYREISDVPELEFSKWLTTEKGVAAIPVSAFYKESTAAHANRGLIRFCFAKENHTLDAALERLATV